MSSKQPLSKTDFLDFLDNPKHLWAKKHNPDSLSPLDDFTRHQLEQGNEVQVLAKEYFRNHLFEDKSKFDVKTEYSFANGPLVTRVDVLVHDLQDDVYDVYEIKGSTNSNEKKKYKLDISFQAQVIADQIPVREFFLVRLNAEYVRRGDIDPDELFVIDSMSDAVEEMRGEVTALIDQALSAMNVESADQLESCFKPEICPCPSICHPNLPEYSIYELSRLSQKKAIILRDQNIDQIRNVPTAMELSERQSLQRKSVIEAAPVIDHKSLQEFLSDLEYPLHFLDYETLGLALPVYDGYKPYQNMVFQYSLHVQQEKGGALEHYEYLATEDEDPGAGLAHDLAQHVSGKGSMIVWSQGFEIARNKEMAAMYQDYKDMLLSLNERSFDLMKAFSQTRYIHPDFAGSASLKKVLPALLPDLGRQYEEMEVSNGAMAMIAWKELIWGKNSEPSRDKLKQDLLAYCRFDTLAMVEILDFLHTI